MVLPTILRKWTTVEILRGSDSFYVQSVFSIESVNTLRIIVKILVTRVFNEYLDRRQVSGRL